MQESKYVYGRWIRIMIEDHPESDEWRIPLYVEKQAFCLMIRALYLAGYGSQEAAELADDLFPWPPASKSRRVIDCFAELLAEVNAHESEPRPLLTD